MGHLINENFYYEIFTTEVTEEDGKKLYRKNSVISVSSVVRFFSEVEIFLATTSKW
jgi:hypothetical protein